jgi:glycosyltransferase involved in cell wall biosynthesis
MGNKANAARTSVVLLGPALGAVSGVSTHLNQLLSSALADEFSLHHFQVGREGRVESGIARAFRFLLSPIAFASYLSRTGPGIVHLNTSINQRAFWRDLGYLFVARAMRRRTVYQVHGGDLPEEYAGGNPALRALMRWVLGLPQAIVLLAQSEAIAYRKFVPAARVEIIPNAIDVLPSERAVSRVPSNAPLRIVYVGRLIRAKGIFEILQAVREVRSRGIAVEVTIAGDGPDVAALKASASQLGVDQNVRFVGSVFGEDKSRLWTEADVFAFPTFHEGLPYALLESMAFGVVPITTAVGAIPDVMGDGLHGLLVPAKDPQALAAAICRLDGDRVALQRMSRSCQQRIREHYTLAHMAREFQALYETL